jgi:hypothetical protein
MNQMAAFEMAERQQETPAPAVQPTNYLVKRSGMRPLAFEGTELCMAMSFVPGAPYWYEINIYRTTEQRFVAAVRIFFRSEDERDGVRAWECESFGEVLDTLEAYDAAHDIRVDAFADPETMTPADLASRGFTLAAKAGGARAQYASLLGEILHELEQGG